MKPTCEILAQQASPKYNIKVFQCIPHETIEHRHVNKNASIRLRSNPWQVAHAFPQTSFWNS